MKKLFHFNFSIFRSGGARRHSPLCSLIIALILVLSISLYPVSPARANALQQIQPVYDTTITQLYEMVSQRMTTPQEDIFNLMLGTYAVGYGGFAQYQLTDPYANESDVLSWLKSCGIQLYNTILSFGGIGEDPITGVDMRPVIKSLVEVAYGVGVKALSYTGVDPESDFLNDVSSSTNFYVPYTLDINASINSAMGYVGGFYDWQFSSSGFTSDFSFQTYAMTGILASEFQSDFVLMSSPRVRFNYNNTSSVLSFYNYYRSGDYFSEYHNLFFNTSNRTFYICNDSGEYLGNRDYIVTDSLSYIDWSSRDDSIDFSTDATHWSIFVPVQVDSSGYDTYAALVQAFFDNSFRCFNSNFSDFSACAFSDFIDTVYVGSSWSYASVLDLTFDLNIADTSIDYVSNPPADSDTLLDIKGLIQDLIDTNDLRAPVINNFYYPDEAAVPEADLDRTTYDPTDYAGVVSVPDGVWDGLATDDHDGFIDYLWYMTKPLVQFTAGFIESVTFGPEGDFDETGPGIIVFGVISLGLAGGLVSKFLL